MKKSLILLSLLLLLLVPCSAEVHLFNDPTTSPTPTRTRTPTQTLTPSPSPTASITPSPTPKIFALGQTSTLANIAVRESDLLAFFEVIDVPTDGFVDGSIMTFKYGLLTYTKWKAPLPSDILFSYKTALQTNREWPACQPATYFVHTPAILCVHGKPEWDHLSG